MRKIDVIKLERIRFCNERIKDSVTQSKPYTYS